MGEREIHHADTEADTRKVGALLSKRLKPGDVVLLEGPLGAGKTTLVRGILQAYGYDHAVRSPTFNLIQVFDTDPPVMHADLYRVKSYRGIGIEDYMDSHVCLIEWPDRAAGLMDDILAWQVHIDFEDGGRRIEIRAPESESEIGGR